MPDTVTDEPIKFGSSDAVLPTQAASRVRMVSSERAMKPYAIFEAEIRSLSRASALSSMAFSFATGLSTFALKIVTEGRSTPSGHQTDTFVLGLVLVIAFAAGAVGCWANSWKNEIIEIIKIESGDTTVSPTLGQRWMAWSGRNRND